MAMSRANSNASVEIEKKYPPRCVGSTTWTSDLGPPSLRPRRIFIWDTDSCAVMNINWR